MNLTNKIFNFFTFLMSLFPIIAMLLIFSFLIYYSYPAIIYNGFGFFQTYLWNPGFAGSSYLHNGVYAQLNSTFGLQLFLLGTVSTSAIAILIAFPVSFLIALNVEIYLYSRARKIMISVVELFAAIPSVVFGLWGILVLEPILYHNVEPWMASNLSFIPGFSGAVLTGRGLLAASIVLSLMIIPIVTSVIVNTLHKIPKETKEGLYALGATKWEAGKYLIFHYAKSSTLGGTLLGVGRALGETMAVLMLAGGAINDWPSNIYSVTNSIAAAIASYLDSSFTDPTGMSFYAIAELALVLVIISTGVNLVGRAIAGRGALRGYEGD